MATSMKSKTTTRKTTAKEPVAPVVDENVKETTVEETTPINQTKTTVKKEVRKYDNSEGIHVNLLHREQLLWKFKKPYCI